MQLTMNGIYLQGNATVSRSARSTARKNNKIAIAGPTEYTTEHLIHLRELIEDGTIKTVIDRTYPLEEMAEAHKFVEQGGKKGNVVVTFDHL